MEDTDENIELILAQWQTCVEMANTVSQRRDAMNNIFITLNLAIITAVSVTWELKSLLVLTAGSLLVFYGTFLSATTRN